MAQPQHTTRAQWEQFLKDTFKECLDKPDPLLAMLTLAISKDIPPQDAVYFWSANGCRNSFWFMQGINMQRDLLNMLVSKPDYLKKHGVDFLQYLAKISRGIPQG